LYHLVHHGLVATAAAWPALRVAYGWVHQAAHLLANPAGQNGASVRRAYQALLHTMAQQQEQAGPLAPAVAHFRKVTASYWPGLFQCYDVPDLPRTNNDLEQYFGAARHLERRATGRKGASPAVVVRGAVRVVAEVATRLQPFSATELRPADRDAWRALRQQVEARHETRREQARFRRNPAAYLAALEDQLLAKPALPP
jgi:hypothetical protein